MKRRLTKVVVFLLLGTIVNVAVAWGCAVWVYVGESSSVAADTISDENGTYCRVRRWDRLGAIRVSALAHPSNDKLQRLSNSDLDVLPPWAAFLEDLRQTGDAPVRASFADARGFPLRSMWCLVDQKIRAVDVNKLPRQLPQPNMNIDGQFYYVGGATKVVRGIELGAYVQYWGLSHYANELRVLPLGLLWPGFLVNSVFYAVIIWLSLFCLLAPRRAIRRSQRRFLGHCLNCDYDLRGTSGGDVCPECGLTFERATLAAQHRCWTKFQRILSSIAVANGIVFPIANFVVFQYSLGLGKSWSPQEVLVGSIALWLLGGLIWVGALVVGILNRRFTQTFLFIMAALLAETVIALEMNIEALVALI